MVREPATSSIPYGGGSSVVWGVNPPEADAAVTVALDRFDRVVEIDDDVPRRLHPGRRARPRARGPARPHGFTLRHFPQSFRFSSLGGWIATRSGGHYATNHTHIDDFVESVRMLTPRAGGSRVACPAPARGRHRTGW